MTPLLRTASSTCGVMFTKAIFEGMLNVRYSVCDFMLVFSGSSTGSRPRTRHRRRATAFARAAGPWSPAGVG